jgi:hypothetical protein
MGPPGGRWTMVITGRDPRFRMGHDLPQICKADLRHQNLIVSVTPSLAVW